VIHVRDFPTSPNIRSASLRGSIPGASGDAFLSAKALMKDPIPVAGLSDDLVSPDDVALFEFINTLRLSVRAKVAAEQLRGLSLSEIVVQVRELVRLAQEGADHPKPFPPRAFRAISRQAVAWCVEAYRPLVFPGGIDSPPRLHAPDPLEVSHALDGARASADRFPARSPTYRGLP
jgi:hypothetical protein